MLSQRRTLVVVYVLWTVVLFAAPSSQARWSPLRPRRLTAGPNKEETAPKKTKTRHKKRKSANNSKRSSDVRPRCGEDYNWRVLCEDFDYFG
jgi:hypothetical protein